jgi:hypothetical protein
MMEIGEATTDHENSLSITLVGQIEKVAEFQVGYRIS